VCEKFHHRHHAKSVVPVVKFFTQRGGEFARLRKIR
jgi:hypothetical protein